MSERIASFLGDQYERPWGYADADQANADAQQYYVSVIVDLVRGYTRGRGFDENDSPLPDVAAVITTASARLASNPSQARSESWAPPDSPSSPTLTGVQHTPFLGFTLAEQAVLNRYRRRAA